MKFNYIIFVVFHNELNLSYYDENTLHRFVFVNVNPNNSNLHTYKKAGLNVINFYEFKNFFPLGKWYTESEVIYNIFKNPSLYREYDYIGFSQYDIDASVLTDELISAHLKGKNHINFEPHQFFADYNQRILMDKTRPNTLSGKGKNCYDSILEDYNLYYNTTFLKPNLADTEINLCSAFLLKKDIFDSMMLFISFIIESRKLDFFDTKHQHRIQGGFLERYYATWLMLKKTEMVNLRLKHNYQETHNQIAKKSIFNRIIDKIFN